MHFDVDAFFLKERGELLAPKIPIKKED